MHHNTTCGPVPGMSGQTAAEWQLYPEGPDSTLRSNWGGVHKASQLSSSEIDHTSLYGKNRKGVYDNLPCNLERRVIIAFNVKVMLLPMTQLAIATHLSVLAERSFMKCCRHILAKLISVQILKMFVYNIHFSCRIVFEFCKSWTILLRLLSNCKATGRPRNS